MRDRWSNEVARTLSPFGVYKKFPDRGYKVKADPSKGLGEPDVEPGFPDAVFICASGGCFVETKTGGTAFPFLNWRPNQRAWYENICAPFGIPYYLFLVMGETITSKKYPRIALLMTAEAFLTIERENEGRKSLPYAYAAGRVDLRLQWAGNSRWLIPDGHPFAQQFLLENKNDAAYRSVG